jgi:putative membrane protein
LAEGVDTPAHMVGYFSYLFTFPSRASMTRIIAVLSVLGGGLSSLIGLEGSKLITGLIYGALGLALPLLASDFFVIPLYREDEFMNPRRFTILTYATSIVYTTVLLLSSLLAWRTQRPDLVLRGSIMATAMTALIRYISIRVFITGSLPRVILASFLQPALCFATALYILPSSGSNVTLLGLITVAVMVGGVQLLLMAMDRWDGEPAWLRLITLFRAFVLAWAEDINEPLEEQITRMGETRTLTVDSLMFSGESGECDVALVIPYIHPGPFRRVGSSTLPSKLVDKLKHQLGCEALVAHGISTHELDMTSSEEADRVADEVTTNVADSTGIGFVSPLMWSESGGARASCQIFGDVALITLSLSPLSYDDLPEGLRERIAEAASEVKITAIVVDSHHSIDLERGLDDRDDEGLFQAAVDALKKAAVPPRASFSVGFSRIVPEEWGLDDGMGPCGIAAIAVGLETGQTSIYLVVDGNNMVPGLRERVVEAVRAIGVDECEVLTSDTHMVTAIGSTTKGYYPVGARMEEKEFIGYTVKVAEGAVSKIRKSSVHHSRTSVPGMTVLGSAGLETLRNVLESGFHLFSSMGLRIIPTTLLIGIVILYLF